MHEAFPMVIAVIGVIAVSSIILRFASALAKRKMIELTAMTPITAMTIGKASCIASTPTWYQAANLAGQLRVLISDRVKTQQQAANSPGHPAALTNSIPGRTFVLSAGGSDETAAHPFLPFSPPAQEVCSCTLC